MIVKKRDARFASGPKTASKKLACIKRAAARRRVKAGYPIETPFTSVQEVQKYLNSDRIVCLRCGKGYKSLSKHLSVHSWTAELYKEFYGLPWGTGLMCVSTMEKCQEMGRRQMALGQSFPGGYPPDAPPHQKQHHRKLSQFALAIRRANLEGGRPYQFKPGTNKVIS